MTQELRHKLCYLAAFLLPILCVKVTSALFGGGPPAAAAVSTPAPPELPPVATGDENELTVAQTAALQYITLLESRDFDDSPMMYGAAGAADKPVTPDPDDFTIGAIMAHRQGALALIRGEWYREGDVLDGTAWKIASIDGATRSVRFVNEDDGRTRDARVPGANW